MSEVTPISWGRPCVARASGCARAPGIPSNGATHGFITSERLALVAALREERLALVTALHQERIEAIAGIDVSKTRALEASLASLRISSITRSGVWRYC